MIAKRLPKQAIITGYSAFSPILKTAPVIRSAWFDIYSVDVSVTAACHSARLGLVVPKAVLPHSVKRNVVKRLIREFFRLARAELLVRDVVIRFYPKKSSLVVVSDTHHRRLSELSGRVLKQYVHAALDELCVRPEYRRQLFQMVSAQTVSHKALNNTEKVL